MSCGRRGKPGLKRILASPVPTTRRSLAPSPTSLRAATAFSLQLMAGQYTDEAMDATNPAVQGTALQQDMAAAIAGAPEGQGLPPLQWLTPDPPGSGTAPFFPQDGMPLVAALVDETAPTPASPSETMTYIQHLYCVYQNRGDISVVQPLIDEGSGPSYKNYSMMYLTLRASLLTSLATASATVLGIDPPGEMELVDFAGEADTPTVTLQRLITDLVPGTSTPACTAVFNNEGDPRFADFFSLGSSLARLASLSSAELERLFTETLDCAVGRLDAWITALATTMLQQVSKNGYTPVIGGYGWLENACRTPHQLLRPRLARSNRQSKQLQRRRAAPSSA